jgi:hypothetical protein
MGVYVALAPYGQKSRACGDGAHVARVPYGEKAELVVMGVRVALALYCQKGRLVAMEANVALSLYRQKALLRVVGPSLRPELTLFGPRLRKGRRGAPYRHTPRVRGRLDARPNGVKWLNFGGRRSGARRPARVAAGRFGSHENESR